MNPPLITVNTGGKRSSVVRDAKGRFVRGTAGGPGRRKGTRTPPAEMAIAAELRSAAEQLLDAAAHVEILERALERRLEELRGDLNSLPL